jgi:glycosyltransferase involved in cell wall biosynthesis
MSQRDQQPPLVFVLPEAHGGISGGNIYNAQLIAALRALGVAVSTMSIGEFTATGAGDAGLCFIDTLNLAEFLAAQGARRGRAYGLIVHHLPSLEPDISPADEALAIEARALPLFERYLSTSQFTTALLCARGIPAGAILTVPPGLPARVAARPRPALPPLSALLVANLIPRKAVLELLQALLVAGVADADLRLTIVGRSDIDPGYAAQCGALVAARPELAQRVVLRGVLPYERMGELYAKAHVLVSAARMETYGMALAEAHAHGLPILASEGGNVREHFRHGHDGLLFDSVPALARGLLELARAPTRLRSLLDEAERAASSATYTWDDAARTLLEQLRARA